MSTCTLRAKDNGSDTLCSCIRGNDTLKGIGRLEASETERDGEEKMKQTSQFLSDFEKWRTKRSAMLGDRSRVHSSDSVSNTEFF